MCRRERHGQSEDWTARIVPAQRESRMKKKRPQLIARAALMIVTATFGVGLRCRAGAATPSKSRIVLLMVWDGLRPDLVNEQDTPNLYALENRGVRFEHHHAIFPTVTMVNAAALATGGEAGTSGILGDMMYFAPALEADKIQSVPGLAQATDEPIDIENSHYLAALDGSGAFNGRLLSLDAIGTQVQRAGGYAAAIGKRGPTFLFDGQAVEGGGGSAANYFFVADDMAAPSDAAAALATAPPMNRGDLSSVGARDAWFAQLVTERALPAAKRAAAEGRPALVVFWQHNPDLIQHVAGLGTAPAIDALHQSDANLGRIESALSALGIADATDLIVVSDHGFATIRLEISLGDLLVAAGIKKSAQSTDVVVASNGGYDLLYLSRQSLASEEARRLALVRITDFAAAQEWCGPIFSKAPSTGVKRAGMPDYLGWIPGTFAEDVGGIRDSPRAPDLVVSFRELPETDNRGLTGPENPAFALGAHGQEAVRNLSYQLIRPTEGLVYSDAGSRFTTGMGMHGAAGLREIHNFCAAEGPGFRRGFTDADPTSNVDVAATIRELLHLQHPADASGRVMSEALANGTASTAPAHQITMTTYLPLQGGEVVTELRFTRFDGRDYLDDSDVTHAALGSAP